MSRIPSAIGPYQVLAQLGEGGMGVVYRARDTKLDRDVAIKLLPDVFASDPERLARFEREAKTLASLNHPHIAQVYAIEGSAIVMELVEGEDLAERLKRGPIPLDEALPIAQQIAEALEAAHDAGIIHRDLKPANIKLKADGTVKVLDFGLAKAVAQDLKTSGPQDLVNSPTITTPAMTIQGVILGTAAYMAPEQAKGKFVDRRADIWAFGCVLYEMLTGKRTFEGEDVSDTLVSILRDDPRWAALPPDTPPHIRQLLRRCLQKDPRKRLPHIGAARIELSDNSSEVATAIAPTEKRQRWLAVGGLGAMAGGAIVVGAMLVMRPAVPVEPREVVEFTVENPPGSGFTGNSGAARFAISPDGRQLVYQLQTPAGSELFIRSIDSSTSQPVPGTSVGAAGNEAQQAFWSPDGRFLAFFDEAKQQLKKLDRSNGLVQPMVEVPGNQLGGSWGDDGTVLFASMLTRGVRRVSSNGGEATQVTDLDASRGEVSHLWPDLLPDGRHFVFLSTSQGTKPAIYLGSLDGSAPRRLFESATAAVVARPDQLLFGRDGALMSQGFDTKTLTLVGAPRIVADRVPATPAGRLAASASRNGVLVHGRGSSTETGAFETYWVDRFGRPAASAPPSVNVDSGVRLSGDGRSLLYHRGGTTQAGGYWVQDTVRGIETPVRNGLLPSNDTAIFPAISPDGTRLLQAGVVEGTPSLVIAQTAGTTAPRELLRARAGETFFPQLWTADGSLFVGVAGARRRLVVLRSEGDPKPADYPGDFGNCMSLSPDGKWFACTQLAGGGLESRTRAQVFVQSFPDPSFGRVAASGLGGFASRWSPKGGELFFADAATHQLMAVAVKTTPRLEVGAPVALFNILTDGPVPFDVMPDGARFVTIRRKGAGPDQRQSIVVTLNWQQRR